MEQLPSGDESSREQARSGFPRFAPQPRPAGLPRPAAAPGHPRTWKETMRLPPADRSWRQQARPADPASPRCHPGRRRGALPKLPPGMESPQEPGRPTQCPLAPRQPRHLQRSVRSGSSTPSLGAPAVPHRFRENTEWHCNSGAPAVRPKPRRSPPPVPRTHPRTGLPKRRDPRRRQESRPRAA